MKKDVCRWCFFWGVYSCTAFDFFPPPSCLLSSAPWRIAIGCKISDFLLFSLSSLLPFRSPSLNPLINMQEYTPLCFFSLTTSLLSFPPTPVFFIFSYSPSIDHQLSLTLSDKSFKTLCMRTFRRLESISPSVDFHSREANFNHSPPRRPQEAGARRRIKDAVRTLLRRRKWRVFRDVPSGHRGLRW